MALALKKISTEISNSPDAMILVTRALVTAPVVMAAYPQQQRAKQSSCKPRITGILKSRTRGRFRLLLPWDFWDGVLTHVRASGSNKRPPKASNPSIPPCYDGPLPEVEYTNSRIRGCISKILTVPKYYMVLESLQSTTEL